MGKKTATAATPAAAAIPMCDAGTGAELTADECVDRLEAITSKQGEIDKAVIALEGARQQVDAAKEEEKERLDVVRGLRKDLADLVAGQKLMF